MDHDSMKKYSDKLFFTLLSGEELDDEDLQEITKHMLDEDSERREKSKQETDGPKWSIAHEKKDALKLMPGEYPRLFNQKMKQGEEDKLSENVFCISDARGNAFFVPTPTCLMFGDLLRANKNLSKQLNIVDTLEMYPVDEPNVDDYIDEMHKDEDHYMEENLDFSDFGRLASDLSSLHVKPNVEPSTMPPEKPVEAEKKILDEDTVKSLRELGEGVAVAGSLLLDAGKELISELRNRAAKWIAKKFKL